MSIYWPSTLPTAWLTDVSIAPAEQVIRTDMDAGPAKVRRRGSSIPTRVSAPVRFTGDQVVTFQAWYDATLKGGAERFTLPHPITRTLSEYRYRSTPAWQLEVPGSRYASLWRATFELELMP